MKETTSQKASKDQALKKSAATRAATKQAVNTYQSRQPVVTVSDIKRNTAQFTKRELIGACAITGLAIALIETVVWLGSMLTRV